ncbi:MAG: hypothetical protein NVSMB14_01580 [Isosphaeraceae bacterium]
MSAEESSQGLSSALVSLSADPGGLADLHDSLGEFCHLFRNRLNCFRLSLYFGRKEAEATELPSWDRVEERYRTVERTVERLQWICKPIRPEPIEADLGRFIAEALREWSLSASTDSPLRIVPLGPNRPLVCRFDPSLLLHALSAVVAWRREIWSEDSTVRLGWRERQGFVELDWIESGPREKNAREVSAPATLALPLLTRILSAHGGDATVAGEEASWTLRCRWPMSGPPPSSMTENIRCS